MSMSAEERIDLDLDTILQLLQARQETCTLQTVLKRGVVELGLKGSCSVTLQLVKGRVVSCQIANSQQNLSSIELVRYLPHHERFTWLFRIVELQQLPRPQQAPEPAPALISSVPRRVVMTQDKELLVQNLPRNVRHVLALIDGKRSVEKIAQMLALSPDYVLNVLQKLQEGEII